MVGLDIIVLPELRRRAGRGLMSATEADREELTAAVGGCHCGSDCADACCQPPHERDAAWHAAARRAKLLAWLSLGSHVAEGGPGEQAVAVTPVRR